MYGWYLQVKDKVKHLGGTLGTKEILFENQNR